MNIAVFISGTGTNLRTIIEFLSSQSKLDILKCVISNKPEVLGLKIAESAGVQTFVIDKKKRQEFEEEAEIILRDLDVEYIFLAGFMRILSADFVNKRKNRIVNIHPSLLPDFKGAHAVRDALVAGVNKTGCTVHFVEPDVDSGAVITQEAVDVLQNDTEETLHARIKLAEKIAYTKALQMLFTSSYSQR